MAFLRFSEHSGAGKTTLLDVIAGYKTGGRITGEILINGQPKETDVWRQISGYAEQVSAGIVNSFEIAGVIVARL